MAGKKDTGRDEEPAAGRADPGLPKGTVTGLPTREQVENALAKIAKKKPT
jgi:hypothetical protein